MYYTVYKTTNKVNGKIYIGVHKTTNLDDGYLGSGSLIRRAISKYGKELFTKEIIHFAQNEDECYELESLIVDNEFVNRQDTYNIVQGGSGGDIFWQYMSEEEKLTSREKRSEYFSGDTNPSCKVKEELLFKIYDMSNSGCTRKEILTHLNGEINIVTIGYYLDGSLRKKQLLKWLNLNNITFQEFRNNQLLGVAVGEDNGVSKLSTNDVFAILDLLWGGSTKSQVSELCGTAYSNVSSILNKNTWESATTEWLDINNITHEQLLNKVKRTTSKIINEEDYFKLLDDSLKMTGGQLSKKYNISRSHISRIISGKSNKLLFESYLTSRDISFEDFNNIRK